MSKLAHSNDETMAIIEDAKAREDGEPTRAELETTREVQKQEVVERYIRELHWSEGTEDYHKTIVAGNLRGFYNYLLKSGWRDNSKLLKICNEKEYANDVVTVSNIMRALGEWT